MLHRTLKIQKLQLEFVVCFTILIRVFLSRYVGPTLSFLYRFLSVATQALLRFLLPCNDLAPRISCTFDKPEREREGKIGGEVERCGVKEAEYVDG